MDDSIKDADELIIEYLEKYPEDFYERLLLGPLTAVYRGRMETELSDEMSYSNLLIDKFATHSMTFYHLSQGIIERKRDDTVKKSKGYDLFSVNALFRVLMETYVTFNWIFVAPATAAEKEFRFLLWKLDGLFEKRKFDWAESVSEEIQPILEKDEAEKKAALEQIAQNPFYLAADPVQIKRVFDPSTKCFKWKYEPQEGGKLRPLKIIELIQLVCRTDALLNMYRYSSLYTHSNFVGVDRFKQMRGKPVTQEYAQAPVKQAIFLTALLIDDMCISDHNAARAFGGQEPYMQRFISSMSRQIKQQPIKRVR